MQRALLIAAVAAMLVLAGCMDVTYRTDVDRDGDISSITMDVDMDDDLYEYYEDVAEDEGHEDVEALFNATLQAHLGDAAGEYAAIELPSERGTQVTVIARDVDVDAIDGVETTVDEDAERVTYRDSDPTIERGDVPAALWPDEHAPDEETFVEYTYVVEMPDNVTDSNAHEIDDRTTAIWHVDELDDGEEIFVESERPEHEPLPGFGAAVAVVAALLAALALARVADRRS